jgi:hypothetical protein
MAASPHSRRALAAIADLKKIYGMADEPHGYRDFREREGTTAEEAADGR